MKKWIISTLILLATISIVGLVIYGLRSQSALPQTATETQGVSESEIVIGSVSALTGPTAFLGTEYLRGAQTYLNAINDAGGIHGRKLRLISYDDQYDPPKTAYYTQKLILQDKVFGLLNFVGTPTGKKIIPLVREANIPLVGLFTGAQIFRNPTQPFIFNIRASYYQEATEIVRYLTEEQGLTKIAILYQYDDFGFDGLKGAEVALAKHSMRPVATASYERNTANVELALSTIKAASPEAIIMVAVYNPATKFISLAKESDFNPVFVTMSFVGPEAFAKGLGEKGEGIIVSQATPPPHKNIIADCPNDYTSLLQQYFPGAEPSFGGLEGFINAKIFAEGLRRTGPAITRTSFTKALESLNAYPITNDLTLTFTDTSHQGLNRVYLTQIKNGDYVAIGSAAISNSCIQAQ